MNRLVVTTECPSCGAPLDFSEGTNALTCGHCRSNLLVTGKGQLLSYYISPSLGERIAIARATMAQRNRGRTELRGVRANLYFIPYYRMTGQDFNWEEAPPEPAREVSGEDLDYGTYGEMTWRLGPEDISSLWGAAKDFFGLISGMAGGKGREKEQGRETPMRTPPEAVAPGRPGDTAPPRQREVAPARSSLYERKKVLLNDRYIEKNFLACDLHGIGIYSLGIRPAVLRLELLRREKVGSLGRIVKPTLGPEAGEEVGEMAAPDASFLSRQIIGKVFSLIYFPFWIVEMESRGETLITVIDAVSGAVVRADLPAFIYRTLDRALEEEPMTIGFRPLVCPNCGWDFPVRSEDSIFPCATCRKAWQIRGNGLIEIGYRVAAAPGNDSPEQLTYLPFWVVDALPEQGRTFRFFIPAFRYRRLKFLLDLALVTSRLCPPYALGKACGELSGVYYDLEDAARLAQFVRTALIAATIRDFRFGPQGLSVTGATLTWFPFRKEKGYLVAPFGYISIPANLLL
ncbi:MAG: hypothetical protein M1497_13630 [Nitrospirae bacterium]|nr:hypothetical protein [Nitrospirota bacterium]